MLVFQTKVFERFAKKNRINDRSLCSAVAQASVGLIDADLGAGLIKQRIARPGKGKSGGFRTILAFRSNNFACFLYGFAKNDMANIDARDLADLHDLATQLFRLSPPQLERAANDGKLIEVKCDEKAIP
jgi:hypothetical protein